MKACLVALICAPLVAAVSPDVQGKFDEFVRVFSKSYGSDEERLARLGVFAENLVEVAKLKLLEEGSASYSHLTPFADLTSDEFSARNGFAADQAPAADSVSETYDTTALPDSFDWRTQGAVNPIKDQKQCGSCWAFATVANIEGAGFVANKKLLSLSEQELVDCDHNGDQGCQGGLPSNAYKFLIQSKSGLELETAYPYKAKNGKKCAATTSAEKAFVGGWKSISTDEDQIAAALMQYGPLAIGINAGPMQMYSGGIAHPSKSSCNPKQLDHGVAIVGFGAEDGKNYWVIRNSWGKSWGESGYYRVVRGAGVCGLNTMVTTATQITLKDNSVERKFQEFQTKFSKAYTTQEKIERLAVFAENLAHMEELQALDAGSASYSHLTPFADISKEEFSSRNGFQAGLEDLSGVQAPALEIAGLPDSFDWRAKGAVNAIKDQKQCGSCWAFATVANIEGVGFVANQKLLSLSEQELVDCDHNGDQGCEGGLPSNAYKFLIQSKSGLELETAYPYKAKSGKKCAATTSAEKAFVGGWQSISTNEDQIGAALAQYGPLAIGINAGPMQLYSGGIAHPSKSSCNPKQLDHGVAIVGFGAESGTKYWVIRNSWGKSWGEDGYYRIVRGVGACGLNTMVATATGVTLKNSDSAVVV